MKKIIIALIILVAVAATLSANGSQEAVGTYGQGQGQGLKDGSGAGRGNGGGYGGGQGRNSAGNTYRENFIGDLAKVYDVEPGSGVLSSAEKDGLLLMVEEEKLARDVYMYLYNEWDMPVFKNISESEQQHMDAVKLLLDAYDIEAPAGISAAGSFSNRDLQNHYDKLTTQGAESLEEALKVGALIEDLDIADLQKLVGEADNEEVKILYQNLMKGSRNHMRSFTAQLDRYGVTYEPQYIEDSYYDKILKYNREIAPIADPDYSL